MSRGTWAIYTKDSGDNWVEDTDGLYPPNEDLNISKTSTQTMIKLANGAKGFFTAETKYNDETLTFSWLCVGDTFKARLETWLENQDDIKIVDDKNNIYYGRFISMNVKWAIGIDLSEDAYDIATQFEVMPELGE